MKSKPIKPRAAKGKLSSELGATPLPDGTFSFDLELGDRYQKFSEEVARIALLGLSAIGFLLVSLKGGGEKGESLLLRNLDLVQWPLLVALAAFAAAVGSALAHRYYATDSLANHLEGLRRTKRANPGDPDEAREAQVARDVAFLWSGRLLAWAAIFLGAGAVALAVTFSIALLAA